MFFLTKVLNVRTLHTLSKPMCTEHDIVPLVVWAEESKNRLRFEIGPSYDVLPTTSQCPSDGQSGCKKSRFMPEWPKWLHEQPVCQQYI